MEPEIKVKSKEQILRETLERRQHALREQIRKGVRVRGDHGEFDVERARKSIVEEGRSQKKIIYNKRVQDILLFKTGCDRVEEEGAENE